ncbi:MAG: PAS domain S-box protein [Mariprofundaceae bacterium]
MQESLFRDTTLSGYSAKAFIILGALTLSLLFYSYYSWRLIVVQQAPLLDTIMQVKVDLVDSHSKLMELTENTHLELDKDDIITLLAKAEILTHNALTGDTIVGELSGELLDDSILHTRLNGLYASIQHLQEHLQPWLMSEHLYVSDLGEAHDQIYESVMQHAELCDDRIHEVIHETLNRQQNIFMLLLMVWAGSLSLIWWKWLAIQRLHMGATEKLRKLSSAVEQAGEFMMITDARGMVEYVNPAFSRISGYDHADIVGQHVSLLGNTAEDKSTIAELKSTILNGEEWHGEFTGKRKSGDHYPSLMSISPIRNSENIVTHYVVIQQDISEHELLEEQLRQSMKMESIGTLVGGIAHDFNNILAGFMGNLFLIGKRADDKEYVQTKVALLEQLSQSAARMIAQLLTFARKDIVRMKPFKFTHFFHSAIELARSAVPSSVEFTYQSCSEDLQITGSDNQLQQVLINLVANASHAVKKVTHPAIHISATSYMADDAFLERHPDMTANEFVHLAVSDNGYGIPKDQVGKIFEPFFTTKEVGQGTGLGLSMVYGAIQSHGGVIDIESEVGRGTTFNIYLPQYLGEIQESQGAVGEIVRGQGETILIVDDDAQVVEVNRELLKSFGYNVIEAYNGREAIEVFEANRDKISLIIMDSVMPVMGGAMAAKRIYQMAPDTKVMFMTGYDNENTLDKELSSLDTRVIFKPCPPDKFSRAIRRELDSDRKKS